MSSNKSENLGLHLWEGEDDFLRTEFNENFQVIDAAVQEEAEAREEMDGRVTAMENKFYVVSGYTGNGSEKNIELGFRPSLLIISGQEDTTYKENVSREIGITGNNFMSPVLTLTETGFTVTFDAEVYPWLNANLGHYTFVAFR